MKKSLFIFIGLILIAVLIVIAIVYSKDFFRPPISVQEETLEGEIIDFPGLCCKFSALILKTKDQKEITLQISGEARISDQDDNEIYISDLYLGYQIRAEVETYLSKDVSYKAKEIKVLKIPNIIVFSPFPHEPVNEIFKLQGKARVFENQFNYKIISGGKTISEGNLTTDAKEMGEYGDFKKEINLADLGIQSDSDIALEVLDYSAKDGSEIDKISVPLKFKKEDKFLYIKLFYNNSTLDPAFSCNKVFPVIRKIPRTDNTLDIAKAALAELTKGPTEEEKGLGYFMGINKNVRTLSLTIENGVARPDFEAQIEYQVGGSCKVAAIRAEITETLKQFPGVDQVIISVLGRTEDVLQP